LSAADAAAPEGLPAAEESVGLSSSAGGDLGEVVTLVAWRHGETDYNVEGRFQGQSDVPLNALGRQQAAEAARYLATLRPSAIFSSDLSRASMTADALAALTGLPVRLDKDLRERYGGVWEGLSSAEIAERYPEERKARTPPGGESEEAVTERASAALQRIADGLPGGSLAVVVSHGVALSLSIAHLLRVPSDPRALGPFGNCHWSVLSRRRTRWLLLEHNVGILGEPASGLDAGRS